MAMPNTAANALGQYRRAVGYFLYLVRDATGIEGLAQEALIRAHRQRDTLRDPAALETCCERFCPWLYQIATHVSIDRMRQRAKAVERMSRSRSKISRFRTRHDPLRSP